MEGFGKSTIGGKLTKQIKAKDAQSNMVLCKTLEAWMNATLAKRGLSVPSDGDLDRLLAALADGLLLLALLHTLTGHAPARAPHSPASLRVHRLDNCQMALDLARPYVAAEIAPADVVDAHAKPVLALLWRLVLCFQVHERPETAPPAPGAAAGAGAAASTTAEAAGAVATTTTAAPATPSTATSALSASTAAPLSAIERQRLAAQKLLAWLGKTLGPSLAPADLTEAFRDGFLLLALVRAYDARLLDLASVTRGPAAAPVNVPRALELAERELGVPRLLDAADMLSSDPVLRPTEQCMIAYLSEFPRVFAAKAAEERGVAAKPRDNYGPLPEGMAAGAAAGPAPVASAAAPAAAAAAPPAASATASVPPIARSSSGLAVGAPASEGAKSEAGEGLGYAALHQAMEEDPARVERLLAAREERLASALRQSAEHQQQQRGGSSRLWEPARLPSPRDEPSPVSIAAEVPRSPRGDVPRSPRGAPPTLGGSLRHPIGSRPISPRTSADMTSASAIVFQRPISPPATDSMQRLAELEAQAEAAARRATLHENHSAALRATLDQIRRENDLLRRELRTIAAQCVGRLQVRVVGARHIQPTNFFTRDADPYVLLKVDKQTARTKTAKRTLLPLWNAEFSFYVKGPLTRLELTLMDWERFHEDTAVASTSISIAAELEPGLQNEQWWTLQPAQYSRGGVAGPPSVERSASREVDKDGGAKDGKDGGKDKERLLPAGGSSASLLHHNPTLAQLRRTPDPMLLLLLTFTPAVPVASAP